MPNSDLILHVGYPKTATTTLQSVLFSKHNEIEYLGKFIPSFRYSDPRLFDLVNSLTTDFEINWNGEKELREYFGSVSLPKGKKSIVLSSENFIHPWSQDPSTIAKRLARVCKGARIAITLREQESLLGSFYHSFGAFGQYLYVHKNTYEPLDIPISLKEWCELQFRVPPKNILGHLCYNQIVGAYEEAFGKNSVKVFVYEKLVADEIAFYEEWADFLKIDKKSAIAISKGIVVNNRADDDDVWNKGVIETVEFGDSDKQRIAAMFAKDNKILDERLKLGLKNFGYY